MTSVNRRQRFSKEQPCPVCQGYDQAPRGQGRRCFGFRSPDGRWANCTRGELAGEAPFNRESQTFAHLLEGECKCGREHGSKPAVSPNGRAREASREVETYDYQDESGKLLYQVVRYESKRFSQRRPDGHGGWEWNLKGTRPVLYRLPELLTSDPSAPVLIPEGEKDVDRLVTLGLVATSNPGGAGKWRAEYVEYLKARRVVVLPDNDSAGHHHAHQVAQALKPTAASVKVVPLPGLPDKGDVSDWLEQGNPVDSLLDVIEAAPEWEPDPLLQLQTDGERVWAERVLPGDTVLRFEALEIRKERTGVHSRLELTVGGRGGRLLGWTNFNIERDEDRQRFTNRCHGRLAMGKDSTYTKELMAHDVDSFCAGLWGVYLSANAPEEVEGDLNEEVKQVLGNYVVEGGGTILFAPPGRGKSWTALLMAVSIDAGVNSVWAVREAKVLFVNLERSAQSVKRRIGLVNTTLGVDPSRALLCLNARGRSLADIREIVAQAVKYHNVEVIVLDSISRAGQGSLVEDRPVNAIVDTLNNLCGTWVGLAHTPRGDESHLYGSVHFEAGADVVVRLMSEQRSDQLGISLDVTKSNDIPKPGKEFLAYEFDRHGLYNVRPAGEGEFAALEQGNQSMADQIEDYMLDNGPATATQIARDTGLNRSVVAEELASNERFVRLQRTKAGQMYGPRHRGN